MRRLASTIRNSCWNGSQSSRRNKANSTALSVWPPLSGSISRSQRFFSLADAHQKDIVAILTSLQRKVNQLAVGDKERKFLQSSLTYLSASSGKHPRLESWTITSYEVEFGQQIGLGGL